MKLTFFGAAGEVTGSATLLETNRARVLVDFGLFQGFRKTEAKNTVPQVLKPGKLDAVVLTHAHLDHIGRLPLLARAGYRGPVFATPATRDIAGVILRDSAKIQAQDNKRTNRKRQRAGLDLQPPLFSLEDVEAVLGLFRDVPYNKLVEVAPGVEGRFLESGHLLGSTSVDLIAIPEDGRARHVVFSGDLGPKNTPILKTAERFERADAVVLETTYGDRDHRPLDQTIEEFEGIVRRVVEEKGKLLVPTFAVGRAQLLLYLLASMFRAGRVKKFPVFLDSPMAIEATGIFTKHTELYDDELQAMRREHPLEEDLDTLQFCRTAEESIALNSVSGPCLIMAGAGMCNAGRILHHLKQNLWKPQTAVLIVGFQAEGSLGRRLVEGADSVRIFGEPIAVKAKVHTLGGFSAHAGQSDLLWWFDRLASARPRVFLNHGESRGREPFAKLLEERYNLRAHLPVQGESVKV